VAEQTKDEERTNQSVSDEGSASQSDAETAGHDSGDTDEPMVEVNGQKVPLSRVANALKVEEKFTQTSQSLSERERLVQAKEMRFAPLEPLVTAMQDEGTFAKMSEVVPGLPNPSQLAAQEQGISLIAKNLDLTYRLWEGEKGKEFTDEQLANIRLTAANTVRDALQTGTATDGSVDFDAIAGGLYREELTEREVQRRLKAEREKETNDARERAQGSTLGIGTAAFTGGSDVSKMSSMQKIAFGRMQKEQAARKK
jgi:hypothetical protein